MKKKHNEGFSLVELLVSIVILAAIVLPTCTSLVLSYRLNAKAKELMQAQLAVSSTVETLMAQGIDADRVKKLAEQGYDTYDFAWAEDKLNEIDDYPGVIIKITGDQSAEGYFSLTVSDDEELVVVTSQIRVRTGGGT